MSEYKKIHGIHIQALASDPSNLGTGQVWYNTTSNQLKITSNKTTGTWATSNNMGQSRYDAVGTGIQTDAIGYGSYYNTTEHYDGSAWTAGGTRLESVSYSAGCGSTSTTAINFGGNGPPSNRFSTNTYHYDGSNWTTGGNMGTGRGALAGAGTDTAGLAFGGSSSPPLTIHNATEHYDGSAWTAGGNLGTARYDLSGCGTQTAGLAFGGTETSSSLAEGTNATEHYDGSAWTAGGNLGTAKYRACGGTGTDTAGLIFGGSPPAPPGHTNATEHYDGSAWTAGGNTNVSGIRAGAAGTQSTGLKLGGYENLSYDSANSEEYDGPGITTQICSSS